MPKNGAGVDPSIEDVNVNEDICELCNGPLLMRLTDANEVYYVCDDCAHIQH